ncbi:hypothetical protein AVEN_143571-1 [Araneus ventricosus]|uniref:Uncharacterized protein n=1 Tax=Araneus ventricosus TaxID=182803 RepID=A0A4Y2AMX8_ARAVE|nr:hypothetical protein AVEN_143571-1 [Araneus ventricosus]
MSFLLKNGSKKHGDSCAHCVSGGGKRAPFLAITRQVKHDWFSFSESRFPWTLLSRRKKIHSRFPWSINRFLRPRNVTIHGLDEGKTRSVLPALKMRRNSKLCEARAGPPREKNQFYGPGSTRLSAITLTH